MMVNNDEGKSLLTTIQQMRFYEKEKHFTPATYKLQPKSLVLFHLSFLFYQLLVFFLLHEQQTFNDNGR